MNLRAAVIFSFLAIAPQAQAAPLAYFQAQQIAAVMVAPEFIQSFRTTEAIVSVALSDPEKREFTVASKYYDSIARKAYLCSRTITVTSDGEEWNPRFSVESVSAVSCN
jgi:hypothetical protein